MPRRHRRLPRLHRARPVRGARSRGRGPGLRRGLERRRAARPPRRGSLGRGAPASTHPQGVRRSVDAPRPVAAADPRGRAPAGLDSRSRPGVRRTSRLSWTRFRSTRACPPCAETPGGALGRSRAPARVREAATSRLRRGTLPTRRARGGARERAQPVPALRPRLDRGGGGGGARHDRGVDAFRAAAREPRQARGLLLRRRRRQRLPRRGAHLARRGLSLAPHPPRRRLEPGAGAATLGARDAGSPRGRPEALRLHGRRARERPDTRPALERRRSASWWRRAPSTTTCACCGARR